MDYLSEGWRRHTLTIAETLNDVTTVRWDRCIDGGGGVLRLYGWFDRPDGRSDFVLVDVQRYTDTDDLDFSFCTSSADESLNAELSRMVGIERDDHTPCTRIEEVFGGLVKNAVKLDP